MFRNATALLLLIAFATQTFERTLLVLDYYVNTGSFEKNCENKLLPQLHCNGQCLLMKKIKDQQKKDQQLPERKSENKNEVIPTSSYTSPHFNEIEIVAVSFPPLQCGLLNKNAGSLFRPPNC